MLMITNPSTRPVRLLAKIVNLISRLSGNEVPLSKELDVVHELDPLRLLLVEQRLRFPEIFGLKAFRKPPVDRRE